jgi:hypothetical protein
MPHVRALHGLGSHPGPQQRGGSLDPGAIWPHHGGGYQRRCPPPSSPHPSRFRRGPQGFPWHPSPPGWRVWSSTHLRNFREGIVVALMIIGLQFSVPSWHCILDCKECMVYTLAFHSQPRRCICPHNEGRSLRSCKHRPKDGKMGCAFDTGPPLRQKLYPHLL